MENFDYAKALDALEKLAQKVEDPSTSLDDIDKYIAKSEELVGQCREYLRTQREKLDTIDAYEN